MVRVSKGQSGVAHSLLPTPLARTQSHGHEAGKCSAAMCRAGVGVGDSLGKLYLF